MSYPQTIPKQEVTELKHRIFTAALALCLCLTAAPWALARRETPQLRADTAAALSYAREAVPSPQEVYAAMMALQEEVRYEEGAPWTNETHEYTWKGGTEDGIAGTGLGCVAFAYELSDAAFGSLPARMTARFTFSDVKVGDILRVNNGAHTVIVLRVADNGVTIAEGNYSEGGSGGKVHWGRSMGIAEVEAASHLITRYPANYVPPDNPGADTVVDSGTAGGLAWTLTGAGTLTVSGAGAMPDFADLGDRPWDGHAGGILKVVIEDGVTSVGSNAFQNSAVLSAEIPDSVTAIGSGAFYGSAIISAAIPAGVKTIGDGAFRTCKNLSSVTVAGGVETIGQNAFRGCTALKSISLPASVTEVGAGAFMSCENLTSAAFVPGGTQVTIGENLFTQCWRLSEVTLPQSINRISGGMFQVCGALSSLDIPQGAAGIDNEAFASCASLTKLTIPDSVTEIGTGAFSNCSMLRDIYYCGSEAQWNSISKPADVTAALATVTIHYDSAMPEPPGPDEPGHTHTWDSGAVTKPADCTSSGVRTYTCVGCGETRTETIAPAGHRYGAFTVTQEASCTEAGRQTASCGVCGDTLTEDIPAKGHRLVRNAGGDYACANELDENGVSVMVVTAAVGDGYLAVKMLDSRRANYAYEEAAARQYVSDLARAALEPVSALLSCTVTTISYTPPTRDADGEYVYQMVIRFDGRAAGLVLTTEPLRLVIPAHSGPAPDPAPVPTPEPDPTPDPDPVPSPAPDREETYSISVPQISGGRIVLSSHYAAKGERVTLSVQPDEGYELAGLTVTDARGRSVEVRSLSDGRFSFTMPGGKVEIRAVFTAAAPDGGDPAGTVPNTLPMPFLDVPAAKWYYESVDYVWKHRLMNGVSDTRFAPDQTVSRSMIWTILARMQGVQTDSAPGGVWYEAGMGWAMEQGVTDGSRPTEDVTREQLAVMLWRNAGSPAGGGGLSAFSDAAGVSVYAAEAMGWAVGCGLLKGSGGQLNPQGSATRAEAAAMIMRFASGL